MRLHLDPRFVRDVLRGRKKATVRLGKRDVKPGDVVFLTSDRGPFAKAVIIKVKRTPLKKLTKEEIRREGSRSLGELLETLRHFYPGITEDTEVTYIEWKLVR